MLRPARLLVYLWAGPTTLVGLLVGGLALLRGGRVRRVAGVLEFSGGLVSWVVVRLFRAGAVTFGHCVLGRSPGALQATRLHERAHVRQAERWGPFFLPAYLAASLWCSLTGRHHYRDNPFERQARREERADSGGMGH